MVTYIDIDYPGLYQYQSQTEEELNTVLKCIKQRVRSESATIKLKRDKLK